MKDDIEIGRMYKSGNLTGSEGEKIFIKLDPIIFYKTNRQWTEYNTLTGKEKKIKF